MLILQYKSGAGEPVFNIIGENTTAFEPFVLDPSILSTGRLPETFSPSVDSMAIGSRPTGLVFVPSVDTSGGPSGVVGFSPNIQSNSTLTGGSQDEDAWWIASLQSSECVETSPNTYTINIIQPPYYTAAQQTYGKTIGGFGDPCTP